MITRRRRAYLFHRRAYCDDAIRAKSLSVTLATRRHVGKTPPHQQAPAILAARIHKRAPVWVDGRPHVVLMLRCDGNPSRYWDARHKYTCISFAVCAALRGGATHSTTIVKLAELMNYYTLSNNVNHWCITMVCAVVHSSTVLQRRAYLWPHKSIEAGIADAVHLKHQRIM